MIVGHLHLGEIDVTIDNLEEMQQVMLHDLLPVYHTTIALGNLLSCVQLVDMMMSKDSHIIAREGWQQRLEDISSWALDQANELKEFGSAHDTDPDSDFPPSSPYDQENDTEYMDDDDFKELG